MNGKKITQLALAMVLISFMLSTFVSLWSINVMARKNMQDISTVLAARIYENIIGKLSEPIVVSRTMAHDSYLIRTLQEEDKLSDEEMSDRVKTYLSGIRNGHNYEIAFVISDRTRHYYLPDGLARVVDVYHTSDQWYKQFVEEKHIYDLDVDMDETDRDEWTVYVNARIEDSDGRFLGICGVGVRMASLQTLFYQAERDYGVRLWLVDNDGLIHVSTEESEIENAYMTDALTGTEGNNTYVYRRTGRSEFTVTKYIDNLNWYLVVRNDEHQLYGWILQISLANLLLCVLVMVILTVSIWSIAKRTNALANASFIDQITGLYNRRAFEEAKAKLLVALPDDDFVCMTADLNGLKTVNDTQGHKAGDELIHAAAQCLKKCLGKYGDIYRIGGDEFAAFLSISGEDLEKAEKELEKEQAGWSGEMIRSLSISCGFASIREFPSENITELEKIADERMYAAKTEYYSRNGIDRRRT